MIDVICDDSRWESLGLAALAERGGNATLQMLSLAVEEVHMSVLGCDDERISALNSEFRGKSVPTNVLSWPDVDLAANTDGEQPHSPERDPDGALSLGDIAIAYDTCAREALEQGKPLTDHATHLLVHGMLHLLGYDHIRPEDAVLMETLEVKILGKLGVPDPY